MMRTCILVISDDRDVIARVLPPARSLAHVMTGRFGDLVERRCDSNFVSVKMPWSDEWIKGDITGIDGYAHWLSSRPFGAV